MSEKEQMVFDHMMRALKAAQEALVWYDAEQFEVDEGCVPVGLMVSSAIQLAEH